MSDINKGLLAENQNFHEMDLIRDAMTNRRLATERLHEDYRKIYKNHQFE